MVNALGDVYWKIFIVGSKCGNHTRYLYFTDGNSSNVKTV